jgi:hypothetical protein
MHGIKLARGFLNMTGMVSTAWLVSVCLCSSPGPFLIKKSFFDQKMHF